MEKILNYNKNINGSFSVSGDKSITHRAIMLGSIATGKTTIKGALKSYDCINTINCFKNLGVDIKDKNNNIIIHGKGLFSLKEPKNTLYVGNSGTTIRLICGILSAQNFNTKITGDNSIVKRPMKRIIEPLSYMGASIHSKNGLAPLSILGKKLHGINYNMPIASAQVKSAILLASLFADKPTMIKENKKSRNHSEIMIKEFGGDIKIKDDIIINKPVNRLNGQDIYICGDISSACFFIAGALITKNSHIIIKNVGINPSRTGFLDTLINMGANISFENIKYINGERRCDIVAKSSKLKPYDIGGDIIPKMIDEIPLFALVASFADGDSTVSDASELKFKESDRIHTISTQLNNIGCNILPTEDGMIIKGNQTLLGGKCESYNDHRIAMCIAIASLNCKKEISINNYDCINTSFPDFFSILDSL